MTAQQNMDAALDTLFDNLNFDEALATLKIVTMLQDAKIPPKDWVRTVAIGVAVMEQTYGKELIGMVAPTESPDAP